jgi:hypothetical protein
VTNVDVHQHLWTASFLAALRARDEPPFLDGWTLHTAGEPPYEIPAAHHDVAARAELAAADGLGRALVSLSAPLGVEWLPSDEARPLLDAYHEDAAGCPSRSGPGPPPASGTSTPTRPPRTSTGGSPGSSSRRTP